MSRQTNHRNKKTKIMEIAGSISAGMKLEEAERNKERTEFLDHHFQQQQRRLCYVISSTRSIYDSYIPNRAQQLLSRCLLTRAVRIFRMWW